jgi:hypothetical protein
MYTSRKVKFQIKNTAFSDSNENGKYVFFTWATGNTSGCACEEGVWGEVEV